MNFSYTPAYDKPLFFQDTQIWMTFFIISMVVLFGFDYLVNFQIGILKKDKQNFIIKISTLEKDIAFLKKDTEDIFTKVNFIEKIHSNNIILKDSIENLFDLIPKKITLLKVKMFPTKLVIQGLTPSKDTYNYLLSIPLKSIFEESTVEFYLADNGWYKFVSINLFEKAIK
jgi:Tfp pilus assembly protein PilN